MKKFKTHLLFSISTYILILASVKAFAQPNISYTPSTNVYTVGTTITPLTPSVTGTIDSYSIDIALPSGLLFDTNTGIISGTPAAVSSAKIYTITAVSTAGNGTTTISLTINPAPPAITYTTPNTFVYGTAITPLSPSNSGGPPDSYSVSPALPSGLSLNTTTGVISGTPTAVAAAADYTVTATNVTGNSLFAVNITVNKAVLTVTGLTANNKPYDGNTTASFTGGALNGVVSGDAVTLAASGTFATKNIGTGIVVTSTSILGGAQAGNYTLTQPTGLSANITSIALTVTGLTANNKPYDGNTTAGFTGGALNGVVSGDVVTLVASGTFATKNVGTGIAVTSTSTLGGAQAGNYTLTQPTGLTANITGIALTLTGLTANNKVYDGTTTVTSFTGGTLNGVLAGDAVTFTASGTFATKNVGTGIAVASTTTLGGAQAGNYTLTQPSGLAANITVKTITLTGATAANKVYDATTAVTITATGFAGVIAGDVVTLVGTGTFASKNVGVAIAVTSTSTLSGAQAGNYTLTQPTGLTANITPAPLTITGKGVNKVYDGTTTATTQSIALSGVIAADAGNVVLGGTPVATFPSPSVGNGLTITVSGYTISGTAAGNYTLTQPTFTAKITPATLTITANNVSKVYGTTLSSPVSGSTAFAAAGLIGTETIGSVTITYGTGSAANAAVGTYSGQVTSSLATGGTFTASNYSIGYALGAILVGAAPFDWTGASSTDWATPGNWTSAGLVQTTNYPGLLSSTDVANIGVNNSFTNNPNIAANLPNSLAGVNFGTGPGTINLTLNGGVTLTTSGNFTLTGTETVNMIATNPTIAIGGNYSSASGTTFNKGGSNPMTISGTTTNAGIFNQSGTGLITMAGTISNSGTINQTSTGNILFTGNFTNSGSSSALKQTGTGSLTFSGTLTNAGTFTQGGGIVSVAGAVTNTGTLNVGTSTFTVTGDFANNGTYTQGTGTILFNNPSIQFLRDASPSGTIFTNVNINNGPNTKIQTGNFGIASTGVLTLSATSGNVTKVTVVSSLTIYSDANSTGTVAALCSTCQVNGNVTVQRYVTGGTGNRGYRLVSSPVYTGNDAYGNIYSINYLLNSTFLTGTTGTAGGFSTNTKLNPTLYLFRENLAPLYTTFLNSNFIGISNIATQPYGMNDATYPTANIPAGDGYLFFFRGGLATVNPYVTTTVPVATTLNAIGTLNQGNIIVRNWYTPGSTNLGFTNASNDPAIDGLNLLGNPYASSIDWNTFSSTSSSAGIYGPNVNNYIYLLNPGGQAGSGNYGVYQIGVGGTNNATNIIPSGAGFFVRANSTGASLTFSESAKTNTQVTTPHLFMSRALVAGNTLQTLLVHMALDSINSDETLISFNSSTKSAFDMKEDVQYKTGTGKVSLSNLSSDNVPLAINQLPLALKGDTIGLKVKASASGTYTLNIKSITGIPQLYDIWLKDAFTKDSVNMRNTATYSFIINNSDTTTFGSNRFKLVLVQNPALAYKLLSFEANKTGKAYEVQLTWKTKNEQDYTHFTIERSNDNGKTFDVIGGQLSTGGGTYGLLDQDAQKGYNLYRLKQEDFNNVITYSNVVEEQFQDNGNDKSSHLSIYPNPATSTINLTISQKSEDAGTYNIRITNSSGIVVKQAVIKQDHWQDNISPLLTGTYLIQVVNNKDNSLVGQTKFVKL